MRYGPILAAIIAVGLPVAAQAQALNCAIPAELPAPRLEGATQDEPKRTLPIGGYTLAVSWSPNYCHGKEASDRDAFQCGGAGGKFGFTLHGLWPDGRGKVWPQYCRPASQAVPKAVVRGTLCSTPSVQLIQHEWSKHGTCMAASPKAYFDQSTQLYRALRFPNMKALARREDVTAGAVAGAFAAANRGIRADMVRVTVSRSGWLDELWLCLDTRMRYASCKAGSGGAARTAKLKISDPG